jgi:hypothetical protein
MFCSGNRFRSCLLGLALLLAGLANFVSLSYDADEQDQIPPVTVELKFVVRAAAGTHAAQFMSVAMNHSDTGPVRSHLPVVASFNNAGADSDSLTYSPLRLTPLLC